MAGSRLLLMTGLLLMNGAVLAHGGGEAGEAAVNPKWVEKRLAVEPDNLWSTEACFRARAGGEIDYRFQSEVVVDFDFHLHPQRDGGYHSVHMQSADAVREGEGSATRGEAGLYCFEFVPADRPEVTKYIRLRYRLR